MKAKFATWYLQTLVLAYLNETLSESLNDNINNGTASLNLTSVKLATFKSSFDTKTTKLNKIISDPKYFTRYTSDQVSDSKQSWQSNEAQQEKEQTTNVTIMGNVNKFQSQLSPLGDYVFGSLLLAACFLGLLGNGCALTLFRFRQRKIIPIEVFFINLAIFDILLSAASYPLSIIASFQHEWNFKELGCTLYAFCCYFLGLSNIFTITAMAFTRYMITCKSVQGNRINCRICCRMVATGYLLAFIMAAMPLLGLGNYEVEPFGLSCTLDWIAKDYASKIYMVLVTIVCVFLPLIILLFCYSQIILFVKHSYAVVKNAGVNKRNNRISSVQLTWISGLISIGFVIAWFPYTIACLSASYHGEVVLPIWLTPGPAMFAKSSIVYNPMIYVFTTERYRKDFSELVQYILCKSSVREAEKTLNTQHVAVTDGDGSTFNQEELTISSNAYDMEDNTDGIPKIQVPRTMKETSV